MRQVHVDIPQTAFVPCPKATFKNVRVAANCPGCEHFKGLVVADGAPIGDFVRDVRIGCAHPITRRMIHVEA